ncbi:S8 family peptidase [Actinopolymorpha sp. B17G11]|uniref:S8 family peptidase n=1 Tax=Actinopolymorpha sp. B17G11 TaxID=3160861 RepID=UPI0032E3E18C
MRSPRGARRGPLAYRVAVVIVATLAAVGPAWGAALGATSVVVSGAGPATADVSAAATRGTHTVTLITGDVARLTVLPGGRRLAEVVQQPATDPRPYFVGDYDGDVRLIPAEAMPYLASGQLDESLFNLTELVAQGYRDDASLPLILTAPATGARADEVPMTPTGVARKRRLGSVSALAVTPRREDARDFWESIDDDTPADGLPRLARGIGKVWLDARVRATLDESAPQIGAPQAWKSGYTGKGVRVAVLDTGYDAAHPDLAGRVAAAQTFVPGETVVDGNGHGTHVASTVGGSGAPSGGRRKGVAPDVDLLVGKVLDDRGRGLTSQIIAGMEWAVDNDARVVNMSLGGTASDGTDPLSQAVDELSARSGALFVTAAGNSGPEEGTVGAPGTATSALTVGAVDKQDVLAGFSSRGPRRGDGAVKPEVTAPGVDIVAARAAGTNLGRDLDEYATALSGTSMATPHVAGAAALLAQRYPDWSAAQLKSVLASSAVPALDAPATAQGTGRIDVAAALAQRVHPSTATVAFGNLAWTGESRPPVTREVTYTNTTAKTVRLDLSVDVDPLAAGSTARADLVLASRRLTIAPGMTATATLRLAPNDTEPGSYAGQLIARGAAAGTLRTAVGFTVGGRTHTVEVSAIDRDGGPALPASGAQLWNVDTGQVMVRAFDATGTRIFQVPSGRYAVMVFVKTSDGGTFDRSVTLLGRPDVTVTSSMKLAFDARDAERMTIRTPRPADPDRYILSWYRSIDDRSALSGWVLSGKQTPEVYIQRFPKVRTGTFLVAHRWGFSQPLMTVDVMGAGGFRLPTPLKLGGSATPAYVGSEELPVVDGGDATPEDLAAVPAAGAVVVIRWAGPGKSAGQVTAAAAAGASLVLFYKDAPGYWSDGSVGTALPAYGLQQSEAQRLLALIPAGGSVPARVTGRRDSAYGYDLMLTEPEVDGPLTYDAGRLPTAEVTTFFHRRAVPSLPGEVTYRDAFVPGIRDGFPIARTVAAPVRRTDHLTTAGDTAWARRSVGDALHAPWRGLEYDLPREYERGDAVDQHWWPALTRPAVLDQSGDELDGSPVARFGDAIRLLIPPFVSGDRQIYGWADDPDDHTEVVLRRGGAEVGRADQSVTRFLVPAEAAVYELDMTARRAPDTWSTTSNSTRSVWTFRSGHAAGREVLPLIQVDYALETDLANQLGRYEPAQIVLTPAYQPGARGPGHFRVDAEVSYDDGISWQLLGSVPGKRGTFGVTLPPAPDGAEAGSVRVTVTDAAGNSLVQRIDRAWRLSES